MYLIPLTVLPGEERKYSIINPVIISDVKLSIHKDYDTKLSSGRDSDAKLSNHGDSDSESDTESANNDYNVKSVAERENDNKLSTHEKGDNALPIQENSDFIGKVNDVKITIDRVEKEDTHDVVIEKDNSINNKLPYADNCINQGYDIHIPSRRKNDVIEEVDES